MVDDGDDLEVNIKWDDVLQSKMALIVDGLAVVWRRAWKDYRAGSIPIILVEHRLTCPRVVGFHAEGRGFDSRADHFREGN